MSQTLPLVTRPLRIGTMEIRNRIVRTAHGTQLARNGISEDLVAFHRERAIGGCAMTILEAGSVHPTSIIDFGLFDDAIIPGYRRLSGAVHEHGMKILQQLWYGGNLYLGVGGAQPYAVSSRPGYLGVVGRPADRAHIAELTQAYVKAALRCREGGLDGVEVHAAHGYVFAQFLSPAYNDRTDEYGGSLENRARFLIETLRAVRAAAGRDFVVGVRVGASQAPNFLGQDDVRRVVEMVQAEGLIDYVNVSFGDYYRMDTMVGGMHHPAGYEFEGTHRILAAAKVPRIAAGRIRTLEEAETLLREGTADMVSMVRAHIADPHIVRKSLQGRPQDVRPCIACNQGCSVNAVREGRIGCTGNPTAGMEASMREDIPRAVNSRRVLVVGGGPAGLEAARTAALAGHRVILAEAAADLGGQALAASRAPVLRIVGDLLQWLMDQVYALGVDVRLGTYITPDDVRGMAPDIVIVATGSEPRMDGFQLASPGEAVPGVDLPHVRSAVDLLMSPADAEGTRALVLDTTGAYAPVALAEHLLNHGKQVTFVTHLATIGAETPSRTIMAMERFQGRGFAARTDAFLAEIHAGFCKVRPVRGGEAETVPADLVVLMTQNLPRRSLFDQLSGEFEAHLVGDAVRPRDMQFAIREGHRTARVLGRG